MELVLGVVVGYAGDAADWESISFFLESCPIGSSHFFVYSYFSDKTIM